MFYKSLWFEYAKIQIIRYAYSFLKIRPIPYAWSLYLSSYQFLNEQAWSLVQRPTKWCWFEEWREGRQDQRELHRGKVVGWEGSSVSERWHWLWLTLQEASSHLQLRIQLPPKLIHLVLSLSLSPQSCHTGFFSTSIEVRSMRSFLSLILLSFQFGEANQNQGLNGFNFCYHISTSLVLSLRSNSGKWRSHNSKYLNWMGKGSPRKWDQEIFGTRYGLF